MFVGIYDSTVSVTNKSNTVKLTEVIYVNLLQKQALQWMSVIKIIFLDLFAQYLQKLKYE